MNPSVPPDEQERLAALHGCGLLDTPPEPAFDRLTALAARIFGVPVALISLVDADRQWFKSRWGWDGVVQTSRESAFCAHTILTPEVLAVEDACADPRFRGNSFVVGPPHFRFYAGAPLITSDGFAVGSLCLLDTVPRVFSDDQRASLQDLAVSVSREIALRQEARERARTEQDLRAILTRAQCLVWHALVERDESGGLQWHVRMSDEEAARRWLPIPISPGVQFADAWHVSKFPEDRAQIDQTSVQALLTGRERYQQEFRCGLTDGRTLWLAEDVQIAREGPNRWHLVGVCTDITERKTLEIERERLLQDALERADRDALTGLFNHRAFHKHLDDEADRSQRAGVPFAVAVLDLDNFKFFNDSYGHAVGDDVLRQVAQALKSVCRSYDTLARFGGDEFALLLPGTSPGEVGPLAARLRACVDAIGFRPPGHDVAVPLSLSVGLAIFPDDGPTRLDALNVADSRLRHAKTGGGNGDQAEDLRWTLSRSVEGFPMLDALVTAVDNKDRYTRRHSEDVLIYSLQIADQLEVDEATRRTLQVAALLHDVGKIGIPDHILRKPGALSDFEFRAVQQHPMMGAVIVGAVPGFEETLDAIRHHHERWDGDGYPFGLRGEETPLTARIMAVADAFSAMTTDRPYRKGMARAAALRILQDGAGTQWDPHCVQAFLRALCGGEKHAQVQ